ncbi:MAG TPA: hypothetical protein VIW24_31420 [Aldersonia sp.]
MNGVVGADVAELRDLATALDQAGERPAAIHGDLTRRTDASRYWLEPDAARFRERWRSSDALRLRGVAAALSEQADRLRRNADEQERASAADGEGSSAASGGHRSDVQAPRGTADLYGVIRSDALGNDGLLIERVSGDDGVARYIVYIGGTGSAGAGEDWANRMSNEDNVWKVLTHMADPYIVDRMLDEIPEGSDVMIVGYSQGGIDAQNLAAMNAFGSRPFNVTDVITYGSPTVAGVHPETFGTNVLHLRAESDIVPPLGLLQPLDAQLKSLAQTSTTNLINATTGLFGQVGEFSQASGVQGDWKAIHMDAQSYVNVGRAFDDSTDSRYAQIRESIARYQGDVVGTDSVR